MKLWMLLLPVLVLSCSKLSSTEGQQDSNLSDLIMVRPDKSIMHENVRDLVTRVETQVLMQGDCNGVEISANIQDYDLDKFSGKISQGCDYRIGLRFLGDADDEIYYTNWEENFWADGEGTELLATEIGDKDTVWKDVILDPTDLAINLGVPPTESIVTPGEPKNLDFASKLEVKMGKWTNRSIQVVLISSVNPLSRTLW